MARLRGWRALGAAWAAALVLGGGVAGLLQVLGPPPLRARASELAKAAPSNAMAAASRPSAGPVADTSAAAPPHAAYSPDAHVPEPQQALLEPAPDFPGAQLPRIAADGRTSMRVYARPYDPADKRPRVAIVFVGFGLATSDNKAALAMLPPAITVGISPYVHDPAELTAAARAAGHEFLITLPMESQGYPLNDSGPHALLTGADPIDNDRNLEWALSRIQGEVGATGASDGLLGERYAQSPTLFNPVRDQLASRGLLYVDPRPGFAVTGAAVDATMTIDDQPDRDPIDAKLAALEQKARDNGVAIGIVGRPRAVTVERVTAWARALDGHGIDLVPVSALVPRPTEQPPAPAERPAAP